MQVTLSSLFCTAARVAHASHTQLVNTRISSNACASSQYLSFWISQHAERIGIDQRRIQYICDGHRGPKHLSRKLLSHLDCWC